jgi:hypothetical protein
MRPESTPVLPVLTMQKCNAEKLGETFANSAMVRKIAEGFRKSLCMFLFGRVRSVQEASTVKYSMVEFTVLHQSPVCAYP